MQTTFPGLGTQDAHRVVSGMLGKIPRFWVACCSFCKPSFWKNFLSQSLKAFERSFLFPFWSITPGFSLPGVPNLISFIFSHLFKVCGLWFSD